MNKNNIAYASKLNFGFMGTYTQKTKHVIPTEPRKEVDEFIYTFRLRIECREVKLILFP